MPAQKFLTLVNGVRKLISGKDSSAGAGDAGALVALDAAGKIDVSMMPSGIGADTATFNASENLSAGDFVNIWNDGGTMKVRKADATSAGKEADGYVLSAVTSGASALVYLDDTNTQRSGLTLGALYYLSTTAGGVTTTAPSASGNIVQTLGRAMSTSRIAFERGEPIEIE